MGGEDQPTRSPASRSRCSSRGSPRGPAARSSVSGHRCKACPASRRSATSCVARAGFATLVELLAAGRTERELQIELEAEFQRSGGDSPGYGTIVGSGPNSAVLHFAPSARELREGELVLIDAGAESRGYVCYVTRTYAVGGRFNAVQAALHELVHSAMQAATERCRPGTEFTDVHRAAALVIADGLADFGDPVARERHREMVNWERVDQLLGFGGIRIENNVLVTDDGFEVLTSEIPVLPA